jgi:pyruvate/2-oxoglutarate dehydrogenase complex dihydrolipoamide dehydrogenase (E3) component
MNETLTADLCIIGAGAGGLTVAAVAAQMGLSVVLVESEKMGGDCLNYGCVPSKSLLAAARVARSFRTANQFGIQSIEPQVDFSKVAAHIQSVIDAIAVHDSVERFTQLGVTVIQAPGKFIDKNTLSAGNTIIKARRYVIATGSSPMVPPIPGLDTVSYLTNETIFGLQEKPQHLIVIGGGPIGCELAQAFVSLGVKVTILEIFKILPHDEPELVETLKQQFITDGLSLYEGIKVLHIKNSGKQIEITIENQGQQQTINGSHLLVATGRKPNISDLNLDAANIAHNPKGIQVDARLRTTQAHIFAIGDVAGPYQFTHMANYQAGIVIQNILFRWPAKADYKIVPWITYTYPELAHVGLSIQEALKIEPHAKVLSCPFADNDRAQTEHETTGQIKIITTPRGCILGVSILGAHAGELILPWVIAIREKKTVRSLANVIVPYPTLSEISKRVAGQFYTPMLFSNRIKWLVRLLQRF